MCSCEEGKSYRSRARVLLLGVKADSNPHPSPHPNTNPHLEHLLAVLGILAAVAVLAVAGGRRSDRAATHNSSLHTTYTHRMVLQ